MRQASRTVLVFHPTHTVVGGVESRQARLAKLMTAQGWNMIFALTRGRRFHDPSGFRAMFPNVETVVLDGRTGTPDGRRRAIMRAIRTVRPAVILPTALVDAYDVLRELKSGGSDVRCVYGLPGINVATLSFLRRHAAPLIDQSFGVSHQTAHLLRNVVGIPCERVHYVPTGVPAASQLATPTTIHRIRLGFVGRFDEDKRILDLVGLCRELDLLGVDFQMIAVGHGLLGARLREDSAEWIERGVLRVIEPMTPAQLYEQVYPYLDACLLFSPWEGMPNALMEAMMHEVVPVTSDYRGRQVQGLIRHDDTGLVFPVGDMAGAARQIERIASSVEGRSALAKRAHAAVSECHGLEEMGVAFAGVLERAIEGSSRRGAVPDRVPETSRQRLSRLIGRDAAEQIRRLLGRSFPHPDAGEWPMIDNYRGPELPDISALTEDESVRFERGQHLQSSIARGAGAVGALLGDAR